MGASQSRWISTRRATKSFVSLRVELFSIAVLPWLSRQRLADSDIGSASGMSVVALDRGGTLITRLTGDTPLETPGVLLTLGSVEQRRKFAELPRTRPTRQ